MDPPRCQSCDLQQSNVFCLYERKAVIGGEKEGGSRAWQVEGLRAEVWNVYRLWIVEITHGGAL